MGLPGGAQRTIPYLVVVCYAAQSSKVLGEGDSAKAADERQDESRRYQIPRYHSLDFLYGVVESLSFYSRLPASIAARGTASKGYLFSASELAWSAMTLSTEMTIVTRSDG
ncbi:hypothetical protein B0H65DRAFT_439655 [Neurospora tetraspora]|uniref:Uncharacterized protein n=1 Tax=Neurospora tetraspora TaxID=94610 RepID=A0AAE0JJ49_9PEZI|nr:hypothetical protein B0H65DRAFT_439655 [Neurospora tetraspora]